GCVIVGDLPYAWYELHDDFDLGAYTCFPIDHYYTDLDGTWWDTNPPNGIYDEHTESGPSDLQPEIWLGRITIDSNWEDEVTLIGNYFRKVHEYRMGNLSLPHKALLYVDDDWAGSAAGWSTDISSLYPQRTVENDVYVTNASDYTERVHEGYEWIQVHCHANHSPLRHAFMYGDGVKGSGGNFWSSNLSQDGQKCLFTNIFTCGSANYTNMDYLCGWYIFTQTYGICSVGSAKAGSMLEFQDFYGPLAAGDCIGDAFREWFSIWAEGVPWGPFYNNLARSWFYGMTILGDPTLSPLWEDINPPANVTDLGIDLAGSDIALDWTAPVTHDVGHYLIYRATTFDGFDFGTPYYDTSGDADPLATIWTDAGAGIGNSQNYFYVVRAMDYGGNEEHNQDTVGKWVTPLSNGWNMVSTPLLQTNTSIDYVLQSPNWDYAQFYDASTGTWTSNLVGRPASLNDLNDIDHTMGIWLHNSGVGDLVTVGSVPESTDIDLRTGWNLVGYPSLTARLASDTLPPEADMLSVCDMGQPYNIMDITDLTSVSMLPGRAYWVRCTSNTTWTLGP
ncbi:MAG: hypothetical protein KAX31_07590, partial [Thermoplasmata archaeon]|nr:hypothetical protein [Thermoplasmata archaeon]